MSNIQDITIKKISIEHGRLIETLQKDSMAMHNRHASDGLLRSGATIAAEVDNSKNVFYTLRDVCVKHLDIIVGDSVALTESEIVNIKSSISEFFMTAYDSTHITMKKSCELSSKPELRERFMPEIENEMKSTLTEVILFIDEKMIMKSHTANALNQLATKQPVLLQNINYILVHGFKNKLVISCALILLIAGWFINQPDMLSAFIEPINNFFLCLFLEDMEKPLTCSI